MGQGVLEGVFRLGKEVRFIEELGRLEVCQAHARPPRAARRWLGAGKRHPVPMTAAVWSRRFSAAAAGRYGRPDRLHRGRYLDGGERLRQAIGAPRPPDRSPPACARSPPEEGCPRCGNQQPLERLQTGIVPQERLQELVGTGRGQRVKSQLGVVRLAAQPAGLGAIVNQQQQRAGQALNQAVEEGLRLGIDPVQVFEDEQQGLPWLSRSSTRLRATSVR